MMVKRYPSSRLVTTRPRSGRPITYSLPPGATGQVYELGVISLDARDRKTDGRHARQLRYRVVHAP